ncbi:MAG: VCBS repeat-containing protein, partial [Phycisphaerales bacterium]|nr:VCBS repeat-containing protein [Phycisphaerales bacterium]
MDATTTSLGTLATRLFLSTALGLVPATAYGQGCSASEVLDPEARYDAGNSPEFAAIGDLDGDGDNDVATANRVSDDVTVLLNNGDGTFAPPVSYDAGDTPRFIAIGDLDGDGDGDLVVANQNTNDASVLLNNGDGTYAPQVAYSVGSS